MRRPYVERLALHERLGGNPDTPRSTVYAGLRDQVLLGYLQWLGLIVDGRDVETGRKVRTVVREVAQLAPPGSWGDWTRPMSYAPGDGPMAQYLVDTYLQVRALPLAQVRHVCRRLSGLRGSTS